MMKTDNKIIIYDDTCPMCAWYTGTFVKTGLLTKEGRQAFSSVDAALLNAVDLERGKNEIPLIDTVTHKVYYGIDALLEILGAKMPVIKTIGNLAPVKWFLYRLYRTVTYNRRVIVAPQTGTVSCFDCAPDFNTKYRTFFMLLCLVINTLLIFPLQQYIASNGLFAGLTAAKLLAAHTALVFFNIALFALMPRNDRFEYLGQVNMLATLFFLLCIPLMLVNKYLGINEAIVNTVYLGILGGLIGREYIRRMKYAGTWYRYRWVIVADAIGMAGFFLLIIL
jgi:predicted DCC family thiol-disulfide oxidoreductase YuxK